MTDQQKAPDAGGVSGLGKTLHTNSSEAQRRRLLARLRSGPMTTLQARRELDILMPAARVFELRAIGHRIDTFRTDEATESGKRHNVARYVLQSGEPLPTLPPDALDKCGRAAKPQAACDG